METLLSLSFWGSAVLFVFSIVFSIIIPGFVILQMAKLRKHFNLLESFVVSNLIGTCVFACVAILGGYLQLRTLPLLFVIMATCVAIFMIYKSKSLRRFSFRLTKRNILSLAFIVVGVSLQVFQSFGSGLVYSDGLRFFRTHAYDGIFHIGLIENIIRSFPPMEPSASGLQVVNYHYLSDVLIAELSRIWHIPVLSLFFQFVPIWTLLLTALGLIALVRRISNSRVFEFLALFFLFFGADAGYLVYWYIHHSFSFEYPVIDNGVTQILNMPHVFAKMLFFPVLLSLLFWIQKKDIRVGLLTVVGSACLFGFKVYFGIFMGLTLLIVGLLTTYTYIFRPTARVRTKPFFLQLFFAGIIFLILTLLIYLPVNKSAGGLTYVPLAWPKLFLEDRNLDWKEIRYKSAVATLTGKKYKVLYYDVLAIIACILAVYGTRILGIIILPKYSKNWDPLFLTSILIPSVIFMFLGLYTMQVSGGYNTFNFFAVSSVVFALTLAHLLMVSIQKNKIIGWSFFIIIAVVTLPRIIYETTTMYDRYTLRLDAITISPERLEGYKFIQTLPSTAVVQTSFQHLHDINSTYTSALGKRQSFISGVYILETHRQPYEERSKALNLLFSSTSFSEIQAQADAIGVTHLLIEKGDTSPASAILLNNPESAVFHNDRVFVYDVNSL